jgi:hypothetical protein
MSEYVRQALETKINADLREVLAAGFSVVRASVADCSSEEVIALYLVPRPALPALPGPGAESQASGDWKPREIVTPAGDRAEGGTPKAGRRRKNQKRKSPPPLARLERFSARRSGKRRRKNTCASIGSAAKPREKRRAGFGSRRAGGSRRVARAALRTG